MDTTPLIHASLADISEEELIEVMLANTYWRSRLFDFYGIPDSLQDRQRVPLSTVPGGSFFGDIDILLADPAHPEKAVAYQVKRIKWGRSQLRNQRPSKLNDFKKAVQQTNLLANVGFWKVFLYVVIVVDSREQNQGQEVCYEGVPNRLKHIVSGVVSLQDLQPRVGLFEIDFTQAMDNPPFTIDTFSGHLHRNATGAPQSSELTAWVSHLFAK